MISNASPLLLMFLGTYIVHDWSLSKSDVRGTKRDQNSSWLLGQGTPQSNPHNQEHSLIIFIALVIEFQWGIDF